MDTVIILCAQKFFGKTAQETNEYLDKLRINRLLLLAKRRELRATMVEGSAEFTIVCEQMKLATQLCRRATRRVRVTKRHKDYFEIDGGFDVRMALLRREIRR